MMNDLVIVIVCLVLVIACMVIGGVIGELGGKNNSRVGALLGLLGPVGWVIVAMLPANAMPAKTKGPAAPHQAKLQAIDPVAAWEQQRKVKVVLPAAPGWRDEEG
jgi:hypothetical protein